MLKVATVFSGIGAIEHALKRMNIEHKIVFACDNGDVDILSKKIDNNLNDINVEATSIKCLIGDTHENRSELENSFNKTMNKYTYQKKKMLIVDNHIVPLCIKTLSSLMQNKNIKPVLIKELKVYLQKIENGDNYSRLFESIKCSVKILTEFSKDNDLIKLRNNQLFIISSNKIDWNSVCLELKEILELSEKYNFKEIIKTFKLISESLSMLHERINTSYILNKIDSLKTFDKKKKYIDELYKSKGTQNKVKQSYMANYQLDEKHFHWNISFLDGKQYENQVDVFVGGSPCQSFSLVGKQRGLEDTRGTLFYEFARLVQEIKPKVFIYENVKAVLSNDSGQTWEIMQKIFTDLDYTWIPAVLNAKDFGIPQNRERIFVVGFRNGLKLQEKYSAPSSTPLEKSMQDFLIDNVSGKYYLPPKGVAFVTDEKNLSKRYTQIDGEIQLCQKKNQQFNWHGDFVFVEENQDMEKTMQELEKYFLSEKVEKYVMSCGTKGFYSKPKTDLEIARPLLTTMHKMHRAGVDNYVTTQGNLRKLTPRECLRLMGFCDSYKIVVSDTAMYQQAGNSIVVDVLIAILEKIIISYPKLLEEK